MKKDDTKVRDKEFSWKPTRKELKALGKEWNYGNPVPPDMRELHLGELQQVAIDWRMLTPIRPKHRQDEEMFSRLVYLILFESRIVSRVINFKMYFTKYILKNKQHDQIVRLLYIILRPVSQVEMGKLEAKTIAKERRSIVSPIRRTKNRAGMIESSVKICAECGEEYCFGEFCGDVMYDLFVRVTVTIQQPKVKVSADTEAIIANMDRKKKRKRKKRISSKKRASRKSGRLLIRSKGMKSMVNDLGRRNSKSKVENEGDSKPVKPFKRKCSKYTKKGFRK